MQIDRPITIALILFAILLLVFFVVMPEYRTFRSLQLELGKKTAEYIAEHDYYAAIGRTYFDLQSRQDDLKKIDDALPQDSRLGKVIYFLQKAATDNGMMVKGLFLSKSAPNNFSNKSVTKVNDIVFSLNVLGDYPSLEKFMITLEQSSRIFEVTTISFSSMAPPTPLATSAVSGIATTPEQAQAQQIQVQQTYDFNLSITTHSY